MPSPSELLRRLQAERLARQQRLARNAHPDSGIKMHNGWPVTPDITPVRVKVMLFQPVGGRVKARFQRRWDFDPEIELSLDRIMRTVCRYFGIRRAELISHRRARLVTYPRQVAMYLARELTPLSLPAIGKRFGNRDHTTVMHGARKIAAQLSDPKISSEINKIKTLLGVL